MQSLVRDRLMLASGSRYLTLAIEPGQELTVENELKKSTSGLESLPDWPPTPEERVGFLRSPRTAMRQLESRLRQYRRSLGNRWTRRSVLALARLFRERPKSCDEATSRSREVVVTRTDT